MKTFLFFLSEHGACRDGYTPSGWCNVKVDNLFSLELLERSNVIDTPDLSLAHDDLICMDASVAKNLFKTTCLAAPIVVMMVSKPLVAHATIAATIVAILIALYVLWTKRSVLYVWRKKKEKKASKDALLETGQSSSRIKPPDSATNPLIFQHCDVINA